MRGGEEQNGSVRGGSVVRLRFIEEPMTERVIVDFGCYPTTPVRIRLVGGCDPDRTVSGSISNHNARAKHNEIVTFTY